MNVNVLVQTLDAISSDSSTNQVLGNIIGSVTTVTWGDIPRILDCYSSDSSMTNALRIITSRKVLSGYSTHYIPKILGCISSDSSRLSNSSYSSSFNFVGAPGLSIGRNMPKSPSSRYKRQFR